MLYETLRCVLNHLINATFVLSVYDVGGVVVMIGVDPIDPIHYWLLLGHQLVTNLKTPSVPLRYHLGITWVPLRYHLSTTWIPLGLHMGTTMESLGCPILVCSQLGTT